MKQGVSVKGNRGIIQAKTALEGWRLGQAIVDSQEENLLRGDERKMPARRQMLAQGWRDRKPSNARWAQGARVGALPVPS